MTEQYTHFAQAVYELRWILVMAGFALMALLWLEENVRRHDAQDKRDQALAELDTALDEVDDLKGEAKTLRWQVRVLSIAVRTPRHLPDPPAPRGKAHLTILPARQDGAS